MKMSSREKTLIAVLLVAIFGYLFVNFVITPLKAEIDVLNITKETKNHELVQINNLIKKEDIIKAEYDSLNNKLITYTDEYFSNLNQEDILLLLNQLNDNDEFDIDKFKFTNRIDEDKKIEELIVKFDYIGKYEDLYKYIDSLENYEKFIRISDMDIESEGENTVSGEIEVNFSSIPLIKKYADNKSYFEEFGDLLAKQSDSPYVPYDSLAAKIAEREQVSDDDLSKIDLYLKDRTVSSIIGFDNDKAFFVGNDIDVVGEITKSENRLYGNDSFQLSYNFGVKKADLEANLVFAKNLIIDSQNKYLSLWVKPNEITGHSIGVIIVDSSGYSYDLPLTNNVDFNDWKVLEVEIPIEINYPCKIQRIYVRSTDYDQKLSGSILFDQLQTAEVFEDEDID